MSIYQKSTRSYHRPMTYLATSSCSTFRVRGTNSVAQSGSKFKQKAIGYCQNVSVQVGISCHAGCYYSMKVSKLSKAAYFTLCIAFIVLSGAMEHWPIEVKLLRQYQLTFITPD